MERFEVEGHEPSLLPEGKWKLVWADEFDGTELDRSKWGFRLNFWGERFDAYTEEGIVLDGNSHIELHRVNKDGCYVSPQLQTGGNSFDMLKNYRNGPWKEGFWPLTDLEEPKFTKRFGYFECRCKFQNDPKTMWSAFWVQSPSIGARFEPEWCGIEADIMECFKPGVATCGNIMGGYAGQCKEDGRVYYDLEETADGWHTFGMDWSESGYVFYCDGKEVSRCNLHVSQVPQCILLTTEVVGYRTVKNGTFKSVDENGQEIKPPYVIQGDYVDDAFIVDYVRVFDRVE